jgi:hypothetical protein
LAINTCAISAWATVSQTRQAYFGRVMRNAKLRRNPVEHLADALAHRMECATAPRTNRVADVELNVLAWQMIGQRLAMGWPLGWLFPDARTALPDAGDVAVEVFQRERQLIGIEALGAAAELRPLKLLDDGWSVYIFNCNKL